MSKILVVDDDLSVAEMYGEALRLAGHDVDVATQGMDALNCCVRSRYALVVSDINMPDIDGVDLLEMIRAQRPGMPVVYITANEEYEGDAKIQKADALVLKRNGVGALIQKVDEILRLRGTNAGTSQTQDAV